MFKMKKKKKHLNAFKLLYKLAVFKKYYIWASTIHRLLSITCPTESQPRHEQKQLIKNHPIIGVQSKWQ